MENNKFYRVMQKFSDEKLLGIVEHKWLEYEAEALAAAQVVLDERKIPWTRKESQTNSDVFISDKDEMAKRMQAGEDKQSIELILAKKNARKNKLKRNWSIACIAIFMFGNGIRMASQPHQNSAGIKISFFLAFSCLIIALVFIFKKED